MTSTGKTTYIAHAFLSCLLFLLINSSFITTINHCTEWKENNLWGLIFHFGQ